MKEQRHDGKQVRRNRYASKRVAEKYVKKLTGHAKSRRGVGFPHWLLSRRKKTGEKGRRGRKKSAGFGIRSGEADKDDAPGATSG